MATSQPYELNSPRRFIENNCTWKIVFANTKLKVKLVSFLSFSPSSTLNDQQIDIVWTNFYTIMCNSFLNTQPIQRREWKRMNIISFCESFIFSKHTIGPTAHRHDVSLLIAYNWNDMCKCIFVKWGQMPIEIKGQELMNIRTFWSYIERSVCLIREKKTLEWKK